MDWQQQKIAFTNPNGTKLQGTLRMKALDLMKGWKIPKNILEGRHNSRLWFISLELLEKPWTRYSKKTLDPYYNKDATSQYFLDWQENWESKV